MVRRAVGGFVLLVVAACAALMLAPNSAADPEHHPQGDREQVVVTPGNMPDVDAAVVASRDAFYAEQQRQVDAYLAAVEVQRLADEAAAAAAARRVNTTTVRPAGTVGECTGFAIPDYIIQRESGGNPSAYNPSGAYGCAQTLLSHYSAGGTCAGLDPYSIEGQRECVWRLSSGGTNLAPWALTR